VTPVVTVQLFKLLMSIFFKAFRQGICMRIMEQRVVAVTPWEWLKWKINEISDGWVSECLGLKSGGGAVEGISGWVEQEGGGGGGGGEVK
jgi:hypothetical protein